MNSGHSADVSIGLLIDGNWLRVAQLGPDFLILRDGAEHSPCDAVIKLRVDDVERQSIVRLPEGISPGSDRVMLGFAHAAIKHGSKNYFNYFLSRILPAFSPAFSPRFLEHLVDSRYILRRI